MLDATSKSSFQGRLLRARRIKEIGRRNSEGEKCEGRDKSQMQFPRAPLFISILPPVFSVHPDLKHTLSETVHYKLQLSITITVNDLISA